MRLDPRSHPSIGPILDGIQEKNVPFMAGSIAYQAFLSLIPLLVLVFVLVTVVGDDGFAASVADATEGFLPDAGSELLEEAIADGVATTGTSVVGLVTLLWGSLKIFRGLDTAFSEIYESRAESSFVGQLRDALVVFVAIGLALVAAGGATTFFAYVPDAPLVGFVTPLLLVVGLTLAFLPMYYFFPDVDLTVRGVLPGVVVAAVGWAALQGLFQIYVAFAADSESAGVLGAILLLLTWLYFGGLVLLVGAVVNATRSGHLTPTEDDRAAEEGKDPIGIGDASSQTDRHRERLQERIVRLERERELFERDAQARRLERDELHRQVSRLRDERRRLDAETDRLRRQLEYAERPRWKRRVRRLGRRVSTLSIGTVEER